MNIIKMLIMILTSLVLAVGSYAGGGANVSSDSVKDYADMIEEMAEEAIRSTEKEDNTQEGVTDPVVKKTEEMTEPGGKAAGKEYETTAVDPESIKAAEAVVIPETETGRYEKTTETETVTEHIHSWIAETEGIRHEPVTETKWIIDHEAYDETVARSEPVYEQVRICVASCRGCGMTYSGEDYGEVIDECHAHIVNDHNNAYGYGLEKSYYENRITGYENVTETVHHAEEGHWETAVITEGYEETVVTGYICSGCQIRKTN